MGIVIFIVSFKYTFIVFILQTIIVFSLFNELLSIYNLITYNAILVL